MGVNQAFWQNKRVLITGHSGFKGSWLTLWLSQLGAHVTGLSLKPETKPNLFEMLQIDKKCDSHILDITNEGKLKLLFDEVDPEIVFHLAAKSLVRESYSDPILTFKTNIMGTANVLNAIRFNKSLKAAVFVTTDKVYKNSEIKKPYQEEDVLGGHDPYSSSKAASEIVIESFYKSFLLRYI
jgi:CDP-glucose 4,6-dehydratase